jgi:molybdate transport system substrate-binding protein
MNQLKEAEMVIEPAIFAKNKLIIAVSKTSDKIVKIADLTAGDIKIVIADESVPVGGYTIKMLTKENSNPDLGENFKAEFMENVVSKELDVKSVVNKVYLGEADAGIVYQTDLTPTTKKKVTMLKIAEKYNIIASYPIALLKSSQNKEAAQQFIDYIHSDDGSNILVKYGFSRPGMDSD